MKKILIILFSFLIIISYAEAVLISEIYPRSIQKPEDIEAWYEREHFYYQAEKNDYWKTPEETIRGKGGDCEDFAILTNYILKDLGYESHILIFFGINKINNKISFYGHAICIFHDSNGWYIYDNMTYMKWKFDKPTDYLNFVYKGWYKAYLTTSTDNRYKSFRP